MDLNNKENKYIIQLYRKSTIQDLDLILLLRDLDQIKNKRKIIEIVVGKHLIHLDLNQIKKINIIIKDIEIIIIIKILVSIINIGIKEISKDKEINKDKEIEIETEIEEIIEIIEIIGINILNMMIAKIEEIETGPDKKINMIKNKPIVNNKQSCFLIKFPCLFKYLCHQFLDKEENVVKDNVLVLHLAIIEEIKAITKVNFGIHSHGFQESIILQTYHHLHL